MKHRPAPQVRTRALAVASLIALAACGAVGGGAAEPSRPWYADDLARCDARQLPACLEIEAQYDRFFGDTADPVLLRAYDNACALDHARSCAYLARIARAEPATRGQSREALLWKACQLGDRDTCRDLMFGHSMGNPGLGLQRDPVRSVDAAERACRLGDQAWCPHAIRALVNGECALGVGADCASVTKDLERAEGVLRALVCAGRDEAGCAGALGVIHAGRLCEYRAAWPQRLALDCYALDGEPAPWQLPSLTDPARAIALLATGCQGGMALACVAEANLRYHGTAAPADPARAVALLEDSCTRGAVEGCFLLGRIHLAGRDVASAVRAFDRTSAFPVVQREAGLRLIDKHHLAEAELLMSRACEAGDRIACDAEGRLIVIRGRQINRAIPLLVAACDQDGSRKACRALAHVYALRRQPALARTYFERGQDHLDEEYRAALARSARAAHARLARRNARATGKAIPAGKPSPADEASVVDDIAFWATAAFPPLALLALPHPTEYGYGFEENVYRDP